MQKVRAKIHLRSIRSNAESFRKLSGTKLCAVVKANAYGHGAEEVVNALNGIADSFAVALIEEGIGIRVAAAGKEILVFT
ncbi:MAG: alanine racemase, partial [Clostridia bacterium]|nr:alanine racemase [Clostridia bacterium]